MNKQYYLIAFGKETACYEGFHKVSNDGKIGYNLDRIPTPEEKVKILHDLQQRREIIMHELNELHEAEKILLKE